jgi:hypothetical protein
MKRTIINPARVAGILAGLFCLGLVHYLGQKSAFEDTQRNLFTEAITLRRLALNADGYTDDQRTTMENHSQLGFQNSLIAWKEAQESKKKNWLYFQVFPGPDDFCAANALAQIGNSLATTKQLEQAEAQFAGYPLVFPGGDDCQFKRIWYDVICNLEIVRHKQESQDDGKGGKGGKDSKNKKKSKPKGGDQQEEQHKPEEEKPDSAGKGSVKKI